MNIVFQNTFVLFFCFQTSSENQFCKRVGWPYKQSIEQIIDRLLCLNDSFLQQRRSSTEESSIDNFEMYAVVVPHDGRPYEGLLKIVENINHRKNSHQSQKVTWYRKKSLVIAKSQTHPQSIAKSQPPALQQNIWNLGTDLYRTFHKFRENF